MKHKRNLRPIGNFDNHNNNARARVLSKPIGTLSKSDVMEVLPQLTDFESRLVKDTLTEITTHPENVINDAMEVNDFNAMWQEYLDFLAEHSDGSPLDSITASRMRNAMMSNPVAWKAMMRNMWKNMSSQEIPGGAE